MGVVKARTPQFQRRLMKLADHPLVGQARGIGMIGAVEIVRDKQTKEQFDPKQGVAAKVVKLAEEDGLILRNLYGDGIAICPPLVIGEADTDEMFDILERALDKAEAWIGSQGLRGA